MISGSGVVFGMKVVNFLLKPYPMRRLNFAVLTLFALTFLLSSCELILTLAEVSGDNCERYSIYRSRIFGEDDLLWEETACDYGCSDLEERFKEKLSYYEDLYSYSYVYSEHVTYSQYE